MKQREVGVPGGRAPQESSGLSCQAVHFQQCLTQSCLFSGSALGRVILLLRRKPFQLGACFACSLSLGTVTSFLPAGLCHHPLVPSCPQCHLDQVNPVWSSLFASPGSSVGPLDCEHMSWESSCLSLGKAGSNSVGVTFNSNSADTLTRLLHGVKGPHTLNLIFAGVRMPAPSEE